MSRRREGTPGPCPACGTLSPVVFTARDLNRDLSEEHFPYRACGTCGLVFLRPAPSDLGRYYPADYYGGIQLSREELARAAVSEKWKLAIVERFKRGGRLLEVGPGSGHFSYLARTHGFTVEALELNENACRFLREVAGVDATQTNAPEQTLPTREPYDVIALWHVIEHLLEPMAVFDAACAQLRPGGLLVVAAPNPRSLQYRLFRARWAHLDAPRHLQLIPDRLLRRRAASHGLRLVLHTTRDHDGRHWNAFGWDRSLCHVVRRAPSTQTARLGRALGRTLAPLEESRALGAAYTLGFLRPH